MRSGLQFEVLQLLLRLAVSIVTHYAYISQVVKGREALPSQSGIHNHYQSRTYFHTVGTDVPKSDC